MAKYQKLLFIPAFLIFYFIVLVLMVGNMEPNAGYFFLSKVTLDPMVWSGIICLYVGTFGLVIFTSPRYNDEQEQILQAKKIPN